MKNDIVWGSCWYNEPVNILIDFLKESIKSLEKLDFNVIPIVFDARFIHNENDIKTLKKEIKNIIVILNHINILPNKNYGVALITNISYKLNIKYMAIVDPDWNIKENKNFVESIILDLIDNNYDLLVPNIGTASGRSNILIGKTVIQLFYPEYINILQSPFPGAIVAKTSKLYKIVNDNDYHFDWGGEWDIISLGIRNNMNISSSFVNIEGVRHRTNVSKMQDSFQIWKAILSNDDVIDRYNNVKRFEIKDKTNRFYNLISKDNNITEIIEIINNNNPSETEKQILYMILYPLAIIIGKMNNIPKIDIGGKIPYNKNELYSISELAIYCMKIALENDDIKQVNIKAKHAYGKYFSNWNNYSNEKALKEAEVI